MNASLICALFAFHENNSELEKEVMTYVKPQSLPYVNEQLNTLQREYIVSKAKQNKSR